MLCSVLRDFAVAFPLAAVAALLLLAGDCAASVVPVVANKPASPAIASPPSCSILVTGNPYLDYGALTTRSSRTWAHSLHVLRTSVDFMCRYPALRAHPLRHEYVYTHALGSSEPQAGALLHPFLASSEVAAFSHRPARATSINAKLVSDASERTKSCMLGARILSIMVEMGPCYLAPREREAWPLVGDYYDIDAFEKIVLRGNFSRLLDSVPRHVSAHLVLCRRACIRALNIYMPYIIAARGEPGAPHQIAEGGEEGACASLPDDGVNCFDPDDAFMPLRRGAEAEAETGTGSGHVN